MIRVRAKSSSESKRPTSLSRRTIAQANATNATTPRTTAMMRRRGFTSGMRRLTIVQQTIRSYSGSSQSNMQRVPARSLREAWARRHLLAASIQSRQGERARLARRLRRPAQAPLKATRALIGDRRTRSLSVSETLTAATRTVALPFSNCSIPPRINARQRHPRRAGLPPGSAWARRSHKRR
jgi:hypothetical protein